MSSLPEPRPPLTVKKAFRITGLVQTQLSLHILLSRIHVVQRYCGGVNYPMCSPASN